MNVAVIAALVSSSVALYIAALAWRFSKAPGWSEQRWFSVAAVSVSVYAFLDASTTLDMPGAAVAWCARVQLCVAGLHGFAWIRYTELSLQLAHSRPRAWLARATLAMGAASLVPGVVFTDATRVHAFAPLGVTYQDVLTTPLGDASFFAQLVVLLLLAGLWARAWRAGTRHAGVHFASLAYLCATVANDALVASGNFDGPYLIDLGFVVPVAAVAYSMTARFAADACALVELRDSLEALVAKRTAELERVQERALRSEKLAALGGFAAVIAHEVSSPAAAAMANLHYLRGACRDARAWPGDAPEALDDSVSSIERISWLMDQLRDAGRLTDGLGACVPVGLAGAIRRSVASAVVGCRRSVRVEVDADEALQAYAQADLLHRVLASVIAKVIRAVPEGCSRGVLLVRAREQDGRIELTVRADGADRSTGASPTASDHRSGGKLEAGFAVSQGLIHGIGGELRFDAGPDQGAVAVVRLLRVPPSLRESPVADPS